MLLTPEELVVCCTILECNSCGYPESKFLATLEERGVKHPQLAIESLSGLQLIRLDLPNGRRSSRKERVYKPLPLLWDMKDELFQLNRSFGGNNVQ